MYPYTIRSMHDGVGTILAYAGVSLSKPHPKTPPERIAHLQKRLDELKQQMVKDGHLTLCSFEEEDDLLALTGVAEHAIEEQLLLCASTASLNNDQSTKMLRKDYAAVKGFYETISSKGKEAIRDYYIRNGIDDDILFDEIIRALQSTHPDDGTRLIGDELKDELRGMLLKSARERLSISEGDPA
ncbi:hypothetical protein ACXWTF_12650 [Thiomicrolovo sp. ZZH C-3]